jgi:hypothetical protein
MLDDSIIPKQKSSILNWVSAEFTDNHVCMQWSLLVDASRVYDGRHLGDGVL